MQVTPEEIAEQNEEPVEEEELIPDEDTDVEDEESEEVEEEVVETEPAEQNVDDTMIAEALNASKMQIESLGGKFDDRGNFVGWEEVAMPNRSDDTTPGYYDQEDDSVDSKIGESTKELRIDRYINKLVAENPLIKIVTKETTAMLEKLPGKELNEQVAKMVAYSMLGMRTPVLVAMAQKEAKSSVKNKIAEAGSASVLGGNSGGTSRPVATTVKVSTTVARYAKAWNLDPIKVQKQVNADMKQRSK